MQCCNFGQDRGGGTEGAQGACAPPVFWEKETKTLPKLSLFYLDASVHPRFLAPCAIPVYTTRRGNCRGIKMHGVQH